jgi:lysophospholipase L1-like esterase
MGINNVIARDSVSSITRKYTFLLSNLTSVYPYSKIVVVSVIPTSDALFNSNAADINYIMNDTIQTAFYGKAMFINVTQLFFNKTGGVAQDMLSDGLHLSKLGYKKFTKAIKNDMDELLV